MKITRRVDIEVFPSVDEVTECFCNMSAEEQAKFFNLVAYYSSKWPCPFCFQMQGVLDSKVLTTAGKIIMKTIGEYGE
jgi:hypothetical protein